MHDNKSGLVDTITLDSNTFDVARGYTFSKEEAGPLTLKLVAAQSNQSPVLSFVGVAQVKADEPEQKTIVGYEPFAAVYTEAGAAPVLPTVVTAVYNDGATAQVSGVIWPELAPSLYAEEGTFTVTDPVIPGAPAEIAKPAVTVVVNPASNGARLTGPANVLADQPFSLTYGLVHVTTSVYAKDLTVNYDPLLLQYLTPNLSSAATPW